jgi:hypothetical protein
MITRRCPLLTLAAVVTAATPLITEAASSSADPTINWVSSPAPPGALVMVNGGGFGDSPSVRLTDARGRVSTLEALGLTSSGLKFKLPKLSKTMGAGDEHVSYDVSVCRLPGTGCSNTLPLNTPDIWWWQGDRGNSSSPGGWLRVFGRSVAQASSRAAAAAASRRRSTVDSSIARGDFAAARTAIAELEAAAASAATSSLLGATLRLTPRKGSGGGGGRPITVTSTANYTTYDALFELPASLAEGDYTAEISSGLETPSTKSGWIPLSMFLSPETPELRVVTIEAERPWPTRVFKVDCGTGNVFERPCGWVGQRSSRQVDAALAQARAAGGGTVFFPRGQYYIDGPIVVPDNVQLVGEGQELVSIVFREDNPDTSPKPGYIYSDLEATRWSVTNLTVYITHHYNSVFYVYPQCSDWTLQHVRVRAVAWAMLSDPCPKVTGRGNRLANFSRGQVGEVVYLGAVSTR